MKNYIIAIIYTFSVLNAIGVEHGSIKVDQNGQVIVKTTAFSDWTNADSGMVVLMKPNQEDVVLASKGNFGKLDARSYAPLRSDTDKIFIISFKDNKFVSLMGITVQGDFAVLSNDLEFELEEQFYAVYYKVTVVDLKKILNGEIKYANAESVLLKIHK